MPYQSIAELQANSNQTSALISDFNVAEADNPKNWLGAGFKALPDNRFIAWYTNPYRDRDNEWFAEKAIEADIERMHATGQYPELWFYHLNGSKFGQVDTVVKMGRFAVALGSIDDTPTAKALAAYAESQGYKLSHGFNYNPQDFIDNTYHAFKTFEISVLPSDSAANPYTLFLPVADDITQGVSMKISQKQIDEFNKALEGTGLNFNSLLSKATKESQVLDAAVSRKEMGMETEGVEIEVEKPDPLAALVERLMAMESGMAAMNQKMDALKGYMEAKAEAPVKPAMVEAVAEEAAPELAAQEKAFNAFKAQILAEARAEVAQELEAVKAAQANQVGSVQQANLLEAISHHQQHQGQKDSTNPSEFDATQFSKMAFGLK